MSNSYQHMIVTLEHDMNEDYAQCLCDAISAFRGVQKVELGEPVDVKDHNARIRVFSRLRGALHKILVDPNMDLT